MENVVYVTDMVKRYARPFDVELWSTYKALEELLMPDIWATTRKHILEIKKILPEHYNGLSQEAVNTKKLEIQERWKVEAEQAQQDGINKHKEMEEFFSENSSISFEDFELDGSYSYTPGDSIREGINPEISLSASIGNYLLVGRADLLIKKNNKITIVDYKFGKPIDKKGHFNQKVKNMIKMLYPMNNITDSNYWHYALQLSLYAYIVQLNNPSYDIDKLFISHFDKKGKKTVYKVDYLKDDVEKLVNYYKKQITLDKNKEKRKPIIY